mgnify:CR=1 FL=1
MIVKSKIVAPDVVRKVAYNPHYKVIIASHI